MFPLLTLSKQILAGKLTAANSPIHFNATWQFVEFATKYRIEIKRYKELMLVTITAQKNEVFHYGFLQ